MKITILDAATIGNEQELCMFSQFGELTIFASTTADQRLNHISDADIIITNKVVIDQFVIENSPKLKLICVTATGINNIDVEAAEKYKISVKNAKAYSTASVAQHTMACLLHQVSQIEYYKNYTASGQYSDSPYFTHLGPTIHSLHGKMLGIIGLGAIGRKVAQLAEAFGCRICYYSTTGKNSTTDYQRLPLQELLSESDYVTIHAPLTDATYKLIGSIELDMMKPSAILLNMGRGGIIDESELAAALTEGSIASACLDVLEHEPLPADSPLVPLLQTEKLLITPHIAWAGQEARKRLLEITAQNIKIYQHQPKN